MGGIIVGFSTVGFSRGSYLLIITGSMELRIVSI